MKKLHIVCATAAAMLVGSSMVYAAGTESDDQPHALSDGNRQMQSEGAANPRAIDTGEGTDAIGDTEMDYEEDVDLESFFEEATANNLAEIQGAKAALKEGSPEIREFAQKMLDDHTALNEELKTLAKKMEIEVSSDPGLIDQGKQWVLERRDGESFDAAYLNSQIAEHQQTIELFNRAQKTRDQEVSALAEKTLPKLKEHLEMAKELSRERAEAEQ
ncbi:MAG: DUF4142 domain-containing protein [Halopseudomonas sp.]|uniref:DUF4142 domain-containing protein n=1 Tax=Halopseudomonas sp. TaxID=2901191 RepID=UPI0030025CFD